MNARDVYKRQELDQTLSPRAFAAYVKQRLGCEGLFYVEGRLPVQRVGLCSGAGGGLMPGPEAGIQAFVTGEAKHLSLIHISFRPREDRPVYCSECFAKMREE